MSDSYMMVLVTAAGVAAAPSAPPATPPSAAPPPAAQAPAAQAPAQAARVPAPVYERRIFADPADCERAAAGVTLPPELRLVCVPVGAVRLLDAPPF